MPADDEQETEGIALSIPSIDGALVRRLREREEPIVVVLHFQLVGIAAGLVFTFFNWRTPLPWEWFCLLMCGVLTRSARCA